MRLLRALNSALASGPVALFVFGYFSYHFVVDDGWPWWAPVLLFVAAIGAGVLEGWRQARRRKR